MVATNMPHHLAIILDGNRRFAKRLMLEPWRGHEFGREKVEKLFDWCKELGIKEITLYSFSLQNFNRPKDEFKYLIKIMKEAFEKLFNDPRLENDRIRIRVIGRYQMFPKDFVDILDRIQEKTKNYGNMIINFALAYGGREELIDAIKKMIDEKIPSSKIDDQAISNHLYMNSDPDLIIRTGGEKRTSNFLPWQSIYSEWFFIDKTWPEFDKSDLINIIKEYSKRERRFGK